jgi:uncharacterized protein YutD
MDKKALQTLIDEAHEQRTPGGVIVSVDETHYQINEHPYELLTNYRDAFDRMMLSDRFNTFYSKYDYLVGDMGFGQLRLRGFYSDERNVPAELKISALQDYLDEHCNLGCPYFVLHNQDVRATTPKRPRRQRETGSRHESTNDHDAQPHRSRRRSQRNNSNRKREAQSEAKPTTRNQSGTTKPTTKPTGQTTTNQHATSQRSQQSITTKQHASEGNGHSRQRSRRRRPNNQSGRPSNGQQKAYVVEKIKPVKPKPVSERQGTVKTVGHSQHRKFTIREKED